MRGRRLLLAAALAALAAGCASTDPRGAFEDTRELVAGRHPGELTWLRDDEARAAADRRVREILAEPLTPEAAAEVALLSNPSLQAELEELGVAQAELAQAARLANPGVSFARLSGGGETRRTVSVFADLVDWLVQPLRRRLAEAELERTRLEVGRAVLETVAGARRALLEYQAAALLAERLALGAEIDQAAAEYAAALHEAGNLTALDLAAARAAGAESRAEARRARTEADRLRSEAALALGLAGGVEWRARAELPEPPEATAPAALDGIDAGASLEERAVAARLDLAAARWAEEALGRALTLARRTRFAPVGVEAGVEREREDGIALTGPVVELRLPLFDTGRASVARLESELARARWQRAALEAAVRSEVRRLAAEAETARELHALYRDEVLPLRHEVVRRTLAEYNQMLTGTFDLLLARQAEVESERRAIEALAGYWRARYELEAALGAPLEAKP